MKIKDFINMFEKDGWYLARTRGSHRQHKHPNERGLVTIAGRSSDELAKGTLSSILKTYRFKMKYLIVVEETSTGYSAYSPDLEGCVATGATRIEVERTMREAIEFHLNGLREEGYEVPKPRTYSTYMEVST